MCIDQNGEGSGVDLEGGCWVCTPPPPPLRGLLTTCILQYADER